MVLPDLNTMTPELLNKIISLTEAGATITGNPPVKSPSLSGFPECDEKVSNMARRFGGKRNSIRYITSCLRERENMVGKRSDQ